MRPVARAAKSSGWSRSGSGTAASSALRVGCCGCGEQALGRRQLDHPPGAHHRDALGDVLHDREVVRDEQVGQPQRVLQILEQVEDLRLDRDVERRDRLVADQDLGLERQGAGDADPLALAAGEAVRVAAHVAHVEADRLQQPLHPLGALLAAADAVDHQGLGHDVGHGHARVERAERVLEDVLDVPAEALQRRLVERQHVDRALGTVEHDPALVGLHRAHDHLADRGLARAALADDRQGLAALTEKPISSTATTCRPRRRASRPCG